MKTIFQVGKAESFEDLPFDAPILEEERKPIQQNELPDVPIEPTPNEAN